MAHYRLEMVDVPELCLTPEWRVRVEGTIEPYLKDPARLGEAIQAVEKVLGHLLAGIDQGLSEKRPKPSGSARLEIEAIGKLGDALSRLPDELSDEVQYFLIGFGGLDDDDFSRFADAGGLLKFGAARSLEAFDKAASRKSPRGRAGLEAHRAAGWKLAEVWKKFTGRGLSRHNRPVGEEMNRDDGPFPMFLRTAIQVVDPRFQGIALAREIQKVLREQDRVDRLASNSGGGDT